MATLILTPESGTWTIPAGNDQVTVFGTAAQETINVTAGANVKLSAFGANDTLNITGSYADYSIHSSGATVFLTHSDGSVIELAAGLDETTIAFSDANTTLKIEPGAGIMLGDQAITTTPADLDLGPQIIDETLDQGTANAAVSLDADNGAYRYIDDATVLGNVEIDNFSNDDMIIVENALATDYSFSNAGTDVNITFNNNGTLNTLSLVDVVAADALVFDEASFEAAIGFDAFQVV